VGRDWLEQEKILPQLKASSYDVEAVIKREDKNLALFQKYPKLIIPGFTDHKGTYDYTFGESFFFNGGSGVLDIGTGDAGVFMERCLTQSFMPPRVGMDIIKPKVNCGWLPVQGSGDEIEDKFSNISFDHVQCAETLEHVDEDLGTEMARQMLKVAKHTVLITSCGLSHHLGQLNMDAVNKNEFLEYKGQPNIESLMDLGYTVRLVDNYQILAWVIK